MKLFSEGKRAMKVILLEDIYKHGVAGEVVNVADGFARNYLIPRKMAAKATQGELKRARKLREQSDVRRAEYENMLNDLARQIDGIELIFGRRAAITGKLFGSVTTQEIADSLMEKTGIDINRRRISQQPLREVGTHAVPVRLGTEISPNLKITIVRHDELSPFLAAREAGVEVAPEDFLPGEVAEALAEAEETVESDAEGVPAAEITETAEAESVVEEAVAETDTTEVIDSESGEEEVAEAENDDDGVAEQAAE